MRVFIFSTTLASHVSHSRQNSDWYHTCKLLLLLFLWPCDPTPFMASSFMRFLDHTQRRTTVGRTPLDEWSARRRDLYLTTHNTYNRQTWMPPVAFEPKISAGERPQTYALDRVATGTGIIHVNRCSYKAPIILSHFNETWIFLIDCKKYPNMKFHENPSSGSRGDPCGRPDGRTDITKLMVAFRNFPNAPKNFSETSRSVTFCYGRVPMTLFWMWTRPENFEFRYTYALVKNFTFS
jgi:hypothetical protein